MALKQVTFNKGQGGLGRPLTGEDYISGMILYTDTLPSGFSSGEREKLVTSLEAAEDLGIVRDFSDETAATGTYEVTAAGAAGDTITLKVTEYKQLSSAGKYEAKVVTLCSFTAVAADVATVDAMAAKINEQINLGTSSHGYSGTVSTDTVTITARDGMGVYLNSGTPITATIVGTIAGTITQFSSGAFSELAIFHYHISEFFRLQPKGLLYVGIYADTSKVIGADLVTLQETFAEGKIRQCMIYQLTTAFSAAQCTTIQSYLTTLEGKNMPISCVVYAARIDAVTDLTTVTDLKTLTASKVHVRIGQDMQGEGWNLYNASAKSITDAGATLGAIALADVAQDIANPESFNFSNGVELERVGFANGDYYVDTNDNTKDLLEDRGYGFLRKFVGLAGSYSVSSRTAVNTTSDYAFIEANRTIDKAIRNLYTTYTPKLSSKILLNADGTIRDEDVAYYQSLGETALDSMIRSEELSAKSVTIDPSQNVLSTSNLTVSVTLVQVAIAKEITINIGYALNI
jgi:hypothetical protein